MAITELDKKAIDEAVARKYYVSTDEHGNKSIDAYYADYRDTNEFLLQPAYDMRKAAFKNENPKDYEPDKALLYTFQDKIAETYDEQRWDIEDEIIREAGFEPSDDMAEEQIEYLRETYAFALPFDHFLKQEMKVNIMLDANDEGNREFVVIYDQREALLGNLDPADTKEVLAEESGLKFLVEQQGHTMDELKTVVQAYQETFYGENADRDASYDERYEAFADKHNRFLASVSQELDNLHNYMNCMTILAKVNMYQFADMMQPGKEITFSKDAMVGVYSPWNGGGSVLEVELEKDLQIPSEKIWDIQIEGAELDNQYSVNRTYGLVGSCWKDVKQIQNAEPVKKPSLNSLIQSAQGKAQAAAGHSGPAKESER